MHELFDKLSEFIWGVSRYRWTALAAAWTLALLGWLAVAQIDAKYPATARLYVDTNRILNPLMDGIAVKTDVKKQVALMSKTLLSRPNLQDVIALNDLDSEITTESGREALIVALQEEIEIYDTNGTKSLYSVEFSHADSSKAIGVVESLVDIFIRSTLEDEQSDTEDSIESLMAQKAEYEERLSAADQRRADFKVRNADSLPGEQGGYYQRMETLRRDRDASELAYQEALNSRNELRQQLTQVEASISSAATSTSPEDIRIKELRASLDELLVRYTEQHPQVSIIRESIADLQAKKLTNPSVSSNRSAMLQTSRVYQSVSTLLAEAESDVAKLRARSSNFNQRISALQGTVESIPLVEAELKQLDRDYNEVRNTYDNLVQKLESARLTGKVSADASAVKVIDPPFVPTRPTDPDKMLLNVLVLLGSIGAGVAFSFFLSLLHPVFYNRRALEHHTNIPVLGGVSMVKKANSRFDNTVSNLNFGILALLLPVVFGGLIYMQLKNSPVYDSLKIEAFSGGSKTVSMLDK